MAVVASDLVKLLANANFLHEAHVEELTALAPGYRDAHALGTELVRRGWLTAYQMRHLNHGTHQDLIFGPYVILEELGQGGMGKVYKARHRRLDRIVALKVINPLAMSGEAVKRFHQEAVAIARLRHPNIVLLYDAAEIDGKHFLALEFIEGLDLDKLLQKRGPLPIVLACDCIRQAALGLQHAHEKNLVHRDIKPSNLVLTRGSSTATLPSGRLPSLGDAPGSSQDGVIKILDLGLARVYPLGKAPVGVAKLSIDGFVVGTPDYLAPEQALDSHSVDIRADIYSLGCTFYELLTGEPPFAAVANGTQKLLSHLQDKPPPIEKLRPDVPAGAVAIIRKMMAKQARDRFQTPGQVSEALAFFAKQRAAIGQAKSAIPVPPIVVPAVPDNSFRENRHVTTVPKTMPATSPQLYTAVPLAEHSAAVRCVMFSADGRRALSGGEDHAIYLWDVLGAQRLRRLQAHTDAVLCVAFAPDGKTAVSGGSDRALILWDVETGAQLARFSGQGGITAAAFAPDGRLLLTGGTDQALHLWDVPTRRYLRQLGGVVRGRHFDAVSAVAVAPDGFRAVSASFDKTIRLWNIQSGRELHCFEGHTDKVYCVAFSPDGLHVASAGKDRTARLWGVISGMEIQRFDCHSRSVRGIAFSPGGRHLLTGGDTSMRLWEVATGEQIFSDSANAQKVMCVAMTPDGSHLLAGGVDGALRLWAKSL